MACHTNGVSMETLWRRILLFGAWTGLTRSFIILGEHGKAKSLLNLYRLPIWTQSALSTGVENDAIEKDNALSHLVKPWCIIDYHAKFEERWTIHIWDKSCESLNILLCQQVWIMMLMRSRMLLCWWPNMADWEVGMHSGCAMCMGRPKLISSTMVSLRHESYQILLCQ